MLSLSKRLAAVSLNISLEGGSDLQHRYAQIRGACGPTEERCAFGFGYKSLQRILSLPLSVTVEADRYN